MSDKDNEKNNDVGNSKNVEEYNITEFSKELSNSYVEYAVSVITSRAIPNIKDGLKSVQRRILFSMFENGNIHSNRFRKSARVVGDVSGKYHPHGETSIYDALVRLAQPFSTYVPLIESQGNFGSIDGDSPAAQRYCISEDSLILSTSGLIKIKSLSDKLEDNIDLTICSVKNINNKAIKFFNSGSHPIIEAITSLGYSIKGSHNHPLLCLGIKEDKPFVTWKKLEELEVDDFLIISKNSNLFASSFFKVNYSTENRSYEELECDEELDCKVNLPTHIDEKLAYIIGVLTFNSSFRDKGIEFTTKEEDACDLLISYISDVFNLSVKKEVISTSLFGLKVYNAKVIDFFKYLDIKTFRERAKEIPICIMSSPKNVIINYIKSIFDISGSMSYQYDNRIGKGKTLIHVSSISINLLNELKILLLNFGIVSTKAVKNKFNSLYKISVCDNISLVNFKTLFNFSFGEKRLIFNCIPLNDLNKESVYEIPNLNSYLRSKYSEVLHESIILKNVLNLIEHKPLLSKLLSSDDLLFVDELIECNYLFDTVRYLNHLPDANVYSIKVDSDCHSFVANGFINHNTECRLARAGSLMIEETSKDIISHVKNYDSSLIEPIYLACKFPNTIINGNSGIAVGFTSFIPSHNPGEVFAAVRYMLDKEDYSAVTYDEIRQFIPGPDFPVSCLIDSQNLEQIYSTGKGVLLTASELVYEKSSHSIIIKGLPHSVKKIRVIQSIVEAVKDKLISGIRDVIDESVDSDYRIKVLMDEGENESVVIKRLRKYTLCTNSSSTCMLFIDNNYPRIFSLSEILSNFITERIELTKKRLSAEIGSHLNSIERIIALFVATSTNKIQSVIQEIIESSDMADTRKVLKLMKFDISSIHNLLPRNMQKIDLKNFQLTSIQIEYLLTTPISRLNKQRTADLKASIKKHSDDIKISEEIRIDDKKIKELLKGEIDTMTRILNKKRVCSIVELNYKVHVYELETEKEILVLLGKRNVILHKDLSMLKVQKRGGKGKNILVNVEEVISALRCTSHEDILIFTKLGYAYKVSSFELVYGNKHIREIINLRDDDEMLSISPLEIANKHEFIIIVTANGLIKKHNTQEFKFFNRNGKRVCSLDEKDLIAKVVYASDDEQLALFSHKGKFIVIESKNLREHVNRNTRGFRGIKLKTDDKLYDLAAISNAINYIMIINENGYAKRVLKTELTKKISKRNTVGVKCVNNKHGNFSCCVSIESGESKIIIATEDGKVIIIKADEVPVMKRATKGVRVINVEDKDKIIFAGVI